MLFFFFGLPAALVFLAAAFGLTAHTIRRLREGGRPRLASPQPLVFISGLALSSAFLVFSRADLMYSPGFHGDETCLVRMGIRAHPDPVGHFPLSTVCSGVEIVPMWVNPTVFALVALAAVALVTLPFAYRLRRVSATPAMRRAVLRTPLGEPDGIDVAAGISRDRDEEGR